MKKIFLLLIIFLSACKGSDSNYILDPDDIKIVIPTGGLVAKVQQPFHIDVESVSDYNVKYNWYADGELVSTDKNFEYAFIQAGQYYLELEATQNSLSYSYNASVTVGFDDITPTPSGSTAYITKVFNYVPAPGQFVNTLPEYEEGDTQDDMNQKVLAAIGNNTQSMITLGSYGGYVVVGFDHTIENKSGLRDFRVLGNAFYSESETGYDKGSCEPGVIQVALDVNKNGKPDDNEWYEIAGSSHDTNYKEVWYDLAKNNGNDVNTYFDFEITLTKPSQEPTAQSEWSTYIKWTDNKNNSGYIPKNSYHTQSYWPQWITSSTLTFKGTRLMQNSIDSSGEGTYYESYKFLYGYADNEFNSKDDSAIDIEWAINAKNQKVSLPGVDFIKIYTGVNQINGWLGECSTEITGVNDLHILGEKITTR